MYSRTSRLEHIFNHATPKKWNSSDWPKKKNWSLREIIQRLTKALIYRGYRNMETRLLHTISSGEKFPCCEACLHSFFFKRDDNALLMSVIFKSHKSYLFILFRTFNFKGPYCFILSRQKILYSVSDKYRNITLRNDNFSVVFLLF